MACIDWKFLVYLHKSPLIVVDLLPKAKRNVVGVHFFAIAGEPAQSAPHIQPISSAT